LRNFRFPAIPAIIDQLVQMLYLSLVPGSSLIAEIVGIKDFMLKSDKTQLCLKRQLFGSKTFAYEIVQAGLLVDNISQHSQFTNFFS
jgi:hypothetical protein